MITPRNANSVNKHGLAETQLRLLIGPLTRRCVAQCLLRKCQQTSVIDYYYCSWPTSSQSPLFLPSSLLSFSVFNSRPHPSSLLCCVVSLLLLLLLHYPRPSSFLIPLSNCNYSCCPSVHPARSLSQLPRLIYQTHGCLFLSNYSSLLLQFTSPGELGQDYR